MTITNSQYDAGKNVTQEVTIADVEPGNTYHFAIYATVGDEESDVIVIKQAIPTTDSSGSTGVVQVKQDLRLTEGSLFATGTTNPLGKNLGRVDVMNDTVTGSGIILNKTGIAAFKNGIPTFQLDAKTGEAFYKGKVEAGNVKIGPGIDPTGTKSGLYINARNYWYDDGSFQTTSENVTRIVTGADALKPGQPTNFVAVWTGQDLSLTFNFDTTLKNDTIDNTHVQFFVFTFKLVSGTFKTFKVAPTGSVSQSYLFTFQQNIANFGRPQTTFDEIVLVAEDIYGNQGPAAIITDPPSYSIPLPVPTITATNANNGYSVNFTNYPTQLSFPSFSKAVVEEFVSASNTDPGNVSYSIVYEGNVNPAIVITPTTAQRWVRARYMDTFGVYTNPSTAYKINPVNPVAANLDLQPPNDVTVGLVAWNGNNIEISYSLPATEIPERFVVSLTTNYAPFDSPALTGFFYKYPDPSGKVIITQDELFGQFGGYYTGYNGLFKSADAADNRTAGVSFIVPVKQSAISSLTPDLNLVNVFGVPNGYVVQPYLVSGATTMEIYESTASTGPWTLKASTSQLFAATVTNYNTKYLRFRWSGAFGDFSQYTAAKSVNPLDPTAFSTVPPNTPSIGTLNATISTIEIGIDTNDTVRTKGYFLQYWPASNSANVTTEIVPSNGAATVSYIIKNLNPGTTYIVRAAGYNDSNIVGSYTTNLTSATLSATVSLPTTVSLTGASYGALASWSAPASPTTPIRSYKVAVYTSAGVLFTEQDTTGTTFSVSGLKALTSYYVKVSTKDIYGNESATVQSNTITLNAAGGTNDGLPVATSPTPSVIPLFGALQVKWDVVSNVDLVTYEVHVSTTNNFLPDRPLSGTSTTKSIETQGTFAVIKQLPNGTPLNYDTTYYVRIVAKDFDGAANASTQASGTPSKVDNGDIAANAVRANQIFAGSVSADKVDSANLLVNKLFSVGSGGTFAIKIDATGNGTTSPYKLYSGGGNYNDAGTAFYLDSTGKFSLEDALTFDGTNLTVSGQIKAQSGYFNGAITVNGLNPVKAMKIGRQVDTNEQFDGLFLDTNNYWYTNGRFKVGTSTLGFSWDGISEFNVAGNITANSGTFKGAVTIDDVQANAGLWVLGTDATYTTGPRVVINKNGLYAYNFGATAGAVATTYINLATTSGAATFVTNNASIAGWTIDTAKIEKLTGSNYAGMSSTGTYAFYAGSSGSGGNPSAKFSVTQGGAVIARDISIIGDGTANTILQIGGVGNDSPFTVNAAGAMKATSATIVGNITASSGNFTGNVFIGTAGSLVSGSVTLPSTPQAPTNNPNTYPILSSSGFILNKAGITFSNGLTGNSLRETTIAAASGLFTTNSANIGGWNVNPTQISNGGIVLDTAISGAIPAIYAQSAGYFVGMTPATNDPTDPVFWAGFTGYSGRRNANFTIDATGRFTALSGIIGENVVIGATSDTIATLRSNAASAASKPQVFRQTGQPSTAGVPNGSIWFNTSTTGGANKPYILVAGSWTETTIDKAAIALANVENFDAAGQAKNGIEAGALITKGGITLSSTGSIKAGQTSYNAGSSGFFLGADNGTPKFSIGNPTGNRVTWDGSALNVIGSLTGSSGTFGTVTISSSGISSTNFSIDSFGNAVFKGDISATSGTFGTGVTNGWLISGDTLVGNTPAEGSQIILDAKNGRITGGNITGTVVVGNRVASSSSSTRVELINASTDSLRALINGTVVGHVLGYSNPNGMVMMAGTTANSSVTSGHVRVQSNYGILVGDSSHYFEANGSTNILNVMGTTININSGANGVVFNAAIGQDRGQVYFQRTTTNLGALASTTTLAANAFLNSSTGLIARSTSSRRYKTNIENISFTNNQLMALRPVRYQGINDVANGDTRYRIGLIAEEVAAIAGLEDIVELNDQGTPENINYNSLAPILISVVQRILDRLDKAGI
jgi:hypothetical protein